MHIAQKTKKHFVDLASFNLIGWLYTTSGIKDIESLSSVYHILLPSENHVNHILNKHFWELKWQDFQKFYNIQVN